MPYPEKSSSLNSFVAESACRFDRLKAPSMSRGWRSPLRGPEASTAEFRFIKCIVMLLDQ
jgi:hypothetical protein